MHRYSDVLVAAICGALLAGCASSSRSAGSRLMGGGAADVSVSAPRMGRDDPAYHYSRLTCAAPASLPGTTARITLADMALTRRARGAAPPLSAHVMLRAVPATVPAGQVSLVASTMGWRTHELILLPLATGATAGHRVPSADGRVDETGSMGKSSNDCAAGTGDGIAPGGVGWITVTLTPGHYELLCNLANHYADGMYRELTVT